MSYFWGALGWLWSKRTFVVLSLSSALLFFVWMFPFGDMADLVTSTIARGTNNQVYMQFETLDLNLLPSPSISARQVSVETPSFPALQAKWLKVSPSWLSLVMNPGLLYKVMKGDPEATQKLQTRFGLSVAAEGVMGADVDFNLGSGSKTDNGSERSRVALAVENLNLGEVRKWADLSIAMQGQASLNTTIQFNPTFADQPEGDLEIKVHKLNLPASTVMIPFGEAMMPVSLPTLTLDHVLIRGRLAGGSLLIEEATFGQGKDPINGRMKGQITFRVTPTAAGFQPVFGPYNITLDLNTSKQVEKDMGFAFILFDSAKTPVANGSRYLFRAQGQGLGPQFPPPSITRINSF